MISSNNPTDIHQQRFRSLVLLTLTVIYLLILAGGIVRSTGSGMGCPDWPKCFGRWIPPTEVSQLPSGYQQIFGAKLKGEVEFNAVKTWIEYVNRLLGVLSGFLVLATLVFSLPYLRKDKSVFWGSVVAFLLIGVNGWLGSRVVATELAQYTITLHLLLAILVVFSLIFVLVRSSNNQFKLLLNESQGTKLESLLVLTMVLTLGQILLGTQVRDALDEVVRRIGYDQRESWIAGLDWRFYLHRSYSIIILAFNVFVVYQLRKSTQTSWHYQLTVALVALVSAEIITGVIMAYFAVPAVAQPIHLFLAVLISGLQFMMWLSLKLALYSTRLVRQQSATIDV